MENIVYDIETPKGCFLHCDYNIETKEWAVFSINQHYNDLYKLIKHLEERQSATWIGFNNLSFDGQVIEWIYRNYESWYNKTGREIAAFISQYASDRIDDSNYNIFAPYREYELTFRQLDIFKIQHFDNINRMVGLKRLEFEMDMEDVEDMPVPIDKEDFTLEEIDDLIYYCKNDILATYENYKWITGDTDHPIYRGTNQIKLRAALSKKFGFDATNYSNSKYGDEIMKTLYCKYAKVHYRDLPRKGTFRKSIALRACVPKHIEFKTAQLQKFLTSVKRKELLSSESFEEAVHFDGQEYTFARGGIHNVISNKQYFSNDEYIIIDADVTSYYVKTILNDIDMICPAHLNKNAFKKAYTWIYEERVALKPLAKKDDDIKGVVAGYKEGGVSVYGKTGDPTSWMHDIKSMLTTCIAGQFSILMLIEAQSLAGHKCIMANTDGATFYIKRTELFRFYRICIEWMRHTNYALEFFKMKSIRFSNVNHYIAEYDGYSDPIMGNVKRKGWFMTFSELHKNKSNRVIPLALYEYFIHGIKAEDFINSYDNIFDFCARSSSGKKYTHKTIRQEGDIIWPKLIRYYVAKEGVEIMRVVRKDNDTEAKTAAVKPKEMKKTVCNSLPPSVHKQHLDNVNRQWYIDKVNEIIFAIENGREPRREAKPNPNQINLF